MSPRWPAAAQEKGGPNESTEHDAPPGGVCGTATQNDGRGPTISCQLEPHYKASTPAIRPASAMPSAASAPPPRRRATASREQWRAGRRIPVTPHRLPAERICWRRFPWRVPRSPRRTTLFRSRRQRILKDKCTLRHSGLRTRHGGAPWPDNFSSQQCLSRPRHSYPAPAVVAAVVAVIGPTRPPRM